MKTQVEKKARQIYFDRGEVYLRLGKPDNALVDLQRAGHDRALFLVEMLLHLNQIPQLLRRHLFLVGVRVADLHEPAVPRHVRRVVLGQRARQRDRQEAIPHPGRARCALLRRVRRPPVQPRP